MLRSIFTGASALALMTTAACAQEEITPDTTAQVDLESSVQMEPLVLDVAQVTTRDDAEAFAQNEFAQADLNQDGVIDENEFIAYAIIKAPIADSTINDTAQADIESQGDADGPANAEEQFAALSKGDDTITETEIVEARVADFDTADVNDDEKLDDTERQQFAALTMPKRPTNPSL